MLNKIYLLRLIEFERISKYIYHPSRHFKEENSSQESSSKEDTFTNYSNDSSKNVNESVHSQNLSNSKDSFDSGNELNRSKSYCSYPRFLIFPLVLFLATLVILAIALPLAFANSSSSQTITSSTNQTFITTTKSIVSSITVTKSPNTSTKV